MSRRVYLYLWEFQRRDVQPYHRTVSAGNKLSSLQLSRDRRASPQHTLTLAVINPSQQYTLSCYLSMGSSPSKSRPPVDISGPRLLAPAAAAAAAEEMGETRHGAQAHVSRRATTSSTPSRGSTPSSTHTHRRVRSANVVSEGRRNRDSAPPPYSLLSGGNRLTNDATVEKIMAPSSASSTNTTSSLGSPNPRYSAYPQLSSISESGSRLTLDTRRLEAATGNEENVLEALREYNTVIIVDDSHSMSGHLWREVSFRPRGVYSELTFLST